MTEPGDDLHDLLALADTRSDPAIRDATWKRTEQHLRRARRERVAVRALVLAAVFAIGGGGGWLARTVDSPAPVSTEPSIELVAVPLIVPVFIDRETPPVGIPSAELSATAVELRAEQTDDQRAAAELYRLAGDSYLLDHDYRNATRCYRLHLARAGDSALTLQPSDSWLLVSLKNAAFKEKTDVVPKTDG